MKKKRTLSSEMRTNHSELYILWKSNGWVINLFTQNHCKNKNTVEHQNLYWKTNTKKNEEQIYVWRYFRKKKLQSSVFNDPITRVTGRDSRENQNW